MQLGALNKQITLFTASSTKLASGQDQLSYTEEITVFAHRKQTAGGETTEADQKVAFDKVTWTIHNVITNLDKKRVLTYNGEYYEITRIVPDHHHEFFLIIESRKRDNQNKGI